MGSSSCSKSFCSNYMLLKPEEASFFDVWKILFSSDLEKSRSVECPQGTHEPFSRRWLMFLSLMVQKLLQATSKSMAGYGSAIEHWLNLVSQNGGFFNLVLNSFKGKVVQPDISSASFISFTGNMDKRMELDPSIGAGDLRYYAALSMMASKASYENKKYIESIVNDHWKMDLLGSFDFYNDYQEKYTTQAFVFDDKKDTIVVAFRGTETFDADAWSSDFDLSWYEIPDPSATTSGQQASIGKVHGGFMKALGMQKSEGWPQEQARGRPETAYYGIRKLLKEGLQKNENARFVVTGHSLGGALAALFPVVLGLHGDSFLLDRLEVVYTFGQPRVGDAKLGEYMKRLMENHDFNCIRVVYSYDLVPRLPYDDSTFMFKHFGTCIYYNSFYHGKVVDEEPNKNYFSILWIIPKFVNTCWELMRSFVIKYKKGAEYEEGFLLRMMRVMGFLVAGVPAHMPKDYVNATRLGSSDVFLSINNNPRSDGQKTLKTQ